MQLVLELPEADLERLQNKARSLGVTAEEYAQRLVNVDLSADQPNIFERIVEEFADVPDEVWASLPTDGAHQHDHYLYGTPKKKD